MTGDSPDRPDDVEAESEHRQPTARKATIRDVAAAAGVAASTVSRAFSRPGRVNAATARRIQEAADRLGYRSTSITSFDASNRINGLIAIVVADLSNPVFADYTRSAQHECLKKGLGLIVIDSEENMLIERNAIRMVSNHIDGIILGSSRLSDAGIRKLAEMKPVVAINRSIRGVQSVITDTTKGLIGAVELLVKDGHRELTYLGGPESSWQNGVRWRIIATLCSQYGIALHRVVSSSPTFSGGYRCYSAFAKNRTTAVITYNDIMAIGFIAALHAHGIGVPEQISVIGMDDVQFSSLVSPALSTVRLPRKELAACAVDEIYSVLNHTKRSDNLSPVVLGSVFVARASTAHVLPRRAAHGQTTHARRTAKTASTARTARE